jgi:hypothetical protein
MRPIYDDCDMGLYMPANIYHDRAGNGNRDLYYGIHYQLSVSDVFLGPAHVLVPWQ